MNVTSAGGGTVRRCGARGELAGAAGYEGAVFLRSPGDALGGTGSQQMLAWVAASGATLACATDNLQACVDLCEFEVTTEDHQVLE